MKENITIPLETYKCLREHLEKANEIFKSLGLAGSRASESNTSKPKPKTKLQRTKDYKELITSGKRGFKPLHLKK